MRLYVISLKESQDRRAKVDTQLKRANIEYEFFDGIRVHNGIEGYFESYNEQQYLINCGRLATAGEIGCYASHLELWRKCVELNQPIMIMEDDFCIEDEFSSAMSHVEKLINDYGYIRLQTEFRGKKIKAKETAGFTLYYYTKMPHSLMCYAINPKVAQTLIDNSKNLTAPVDVVIKKIWQHQIPMFGLAPYPVRECDEENVSTIQGRVSKKKSIRIKLLRLLTKVGWVFKRLSYNFKQIKQLKQVGLITR
ncbi:MAG: glycosyltransferase family 25 protein [Gammaproteobacteria bacterium]|nr:glycosyltransferase family 25 protein [Gammaproteobacteria bacterium]